MRYTASIIVYDGAKDLAKALKLNDDAKSDRSSIAVRKDGDSLVIEISAKDAVALRAAVNSMTKLLVVFDKAGNIRE